MNARPRLAVLADFPEEGWPSMDLVAEMLLAQSSALDALRVCPPYRRLFGRIPKLGRLTRNADRLVNRLVNYPRHLSRRRGEFDLFHVVDHSYAHLVHSVPAERAGVFCHDLDTFACLLDPGREGRPRWFRAMTRRILTGMQKAAIVFHTTDQVRQQIERHGLIDPTRLVKAPLGVSDEFSTDGVDDLDVTKLLDGRPFLLHVGSCIARKRIDVLLDVFAALRSERQELRLVKVGGPWTVEQRTQIAKLGIDVGILTLRDLTRRGIATLYRRAAVVLVPSDAEGFGLPVIEALACGAAVVASDLPVLREVAGDAAVYCAVGDVPAWATAVATLLDDPGSAPTRANRLARAATYTWPEHARAVFGAYERLIESPP